MISAWVLLLTAAAGARAQSVSPSAQTDDTRPATTTFLGDTGLWFVPTAEVLAHGKWSVSGYRRGTNYIQGFTNVGDFAGTFAVGIKDRAEIFGSFLFDTRIDRDLRPLFTTADSQVGGIIDRYPRQNNTWSGDKIGDLYVGAKVNLLSQSRQNPAAIAVRGIVKVPTGDKTAGVSTGKTDVLLDFILSREMAERLEMSGYGGYEFRGKPDGIDAPSGAIRWGAGATFPSRAPLRAVLEVNGVVPNSGTAHDHERLDRRRRQQRRAQRVEYREPHARDRRPDLADEGRLLSGRRRQLECADAHPRRLQRRLDAGPGRRLLRLAGPSRVSPGRERLCRAASAATTAAASATPVARNRPPTRNGSVRSVHGGNRQDLHGDGDGAADSGWV